jgi:putative endonuclease
MIDEYEREPAVYILANRYRGTIYVGVTGKLYRRVMEHRAKVHGGFTAKYNLNVLVWYEHHATMATAIRRETQLKAWKRAWKIGLIEKTNRNWVDLIEQIEWREAFS